MAYINPTYGGAAIFGIAVHIVPSDDPLARQEDAFPGVPGILSLTLSSRGRTFQIDGVLYADSIPDLYPLTNPFKCNLPGSYADGIARTLIDTVGQEWDNVLCTGIFTPSPQGPLWLAGGGFALPYRAVFRGLA
jgi:hypothetical protein